MQSLTLRVKVVRVKSHVVSLRTLKKERTRDALVEAALKLFRAKGFAQTTTEEIAAAAEVAPRTFFRYFASKEDVVFNGLDDRAEMVARFVAEHRSGPLTVDDLVAFRIRAGSGQSLTHAAESLRLVEKTPELRARQQQLLERMYTLLATGLTPARASKAESLRIQMLCAAFLSALNVAMNSWLLGGAKGSLDEHVKMVGEQLKRGFSQ